MTNMKQMKQMIHGEAYINVGQIFAWPRPDASSKFTDISY